MGLHTMFILTYIIVRSCQLKRQGRPFNQFFAPPAKSSKIRPSSISEAGLIASHISNTSIIYPTITAPPAAVPRRLRAADLDAGGRRLGIPDLEHGPFDPKDMLPAYEKAGGPPTYAAGGHSDGPPTYVDGDIITSSLTSGVYEPVNS